MIYFNPPHEVRDEAKLQSMIATLQNGGKLPPVVVCGDDAFTGSHRLAAWEACEITPDFLEISERDYILAVALMNGVNDLNLDDPDDVEFFHNHLNSEVNDYNAFCAALAKVSNSDDVKNAIADQVD